MFLFLTAALLVNPLASGDVLEPSICNEVDRAVTRAPVDAPYIPKEFFPEVLARLGVQKGVSFTDVAIKIVSLQKADGRWYDANTNDVTFVARMTLEALPAGEARTPLFVTAEEIDQEARRRKVPFGDVCRDLSALGSVKLELDSLLTKEKLLKIRENALKVVCVVVRAGSGFKEEALLEAIGAAAEVKSPCVLIVRQKDSPSVAELNEAAARCLRTGGLKNIRVSVMK